MRYTRRETLPHSANAVEREPQTVSIMVWCIGGTEEGGILSKSRDAEIELTKPAYGTSTFARPTEEEASLI